MGAHQQPHKHWQLERAVRLLPLIDVKFTPFSFFDISLEDFEIFLQAGQVLFLISQHSEHVAGKCPPNEEWKLPRFQHPLEYGQGPWLSLHHPLYH